MVKSLAEFSSNMKDDETLIVLPSGVQITLPEPNKRKAIGFGRENEEIIESRRNQLFKALGVRPVVGFTKDKEYTLNVPSLNAHAVGFGRENEPVAVPPKGVKAPKRTASIGYVKPSVLNTAFKAQHAVGFGRENEPSVKIPKRVRIAGYLKDRER